MERGRMDVGRISDICRLGVVSNAGYDNMDNS